MGRWAQRRRAGTAAPPAAAAQALITNVQHVNLAGVFYSDVTFDTALSAVTPGVGDLQVSSEGATIDSQQASNKVRYGTYDGSAVGAPYDLDDPTGLTFVGGKTLGPPTTGLQT